MEKNIKWWKNALVYQIYPLSFKDSNNDGIGDINGIRSKLTYLKDLGVDVIWLSPIYQSPMDDNGYDISDYYSINPIFGTMDDFQKLLDEVHSLDMKLIMDLVVNHTSNEHVWFKEAINNPESKYRDYYIWSKKPNDIKSVFSGPAWTLDEKSNEYYFHLFSKTQPDLNWENENLRKEIYKMINYWLDLGIDGFRLDVIDLIGKNISTNQIADGPYLEKHLKEMYETCFKGRNIMTVGETPALTVKRAKELTTYPKNYLDMVFQFSHIALDEDITKGKWHLKDLNIVELKKLFQEIQNEFENEGWTSLFWSNHDQPRAVSRYGDDNKYWYESATMLFTILYGMKGTSFVYQGEEIGMTKADFTKIEQYKDIETINMYNEYLSMGYDKDWIMRSLKAKSRDNSRTPFQWSSDNYAGFSNVQPWLNVNSNYLNINALSQIKDEKSIYTYVKEFFKYRKENDIFSKGKTNFINIESNYLYMYERVYKNEKILIVANYSSDENILNYDLSKYKLIMSNYEKNINEKLPPYYVGVYKEDLSGNN